MKKRLSDRLALIVSRGGALSDALTHALSAEGARVVHAHSDSSPQEQFATCVKEHGGVDALFVTAPADTARWCSEAALVIAARNGAIVATVTVRALAGDLRGHAEAAHGGAAVALIRGLATEYGRAGLRANCIAVLPDDESPETFSRHTLVAVPTPEDVAKVAVFLASDDAGFVTGQVVRCDGGLLTHLPHFALLRDAGIATVRQPSVEA